MEMILITKYPTITRSKIFYQEAFSLALIGSYQGAVRLLLNKGAGGDRSGSLGWPERQNILTGLDIITCKSHEIIVRLLVESGLENGVDVLEKSESGWTALHLVAFQGHTSLVRLLLEKGANVHALSIDRRTPLHIAASQGHDAVVELLLGSWADVSAKDNIGWSALDFAVQKAAADLVVVGRPDILPWVYYHDHRTKLQAVRSVPSTTARTIRLLLGKLDNLETTTEPKMPELVYEGSGNTAKMGEALPLVPNGGTTKFIAPYIEELVSFGGAIKLERSLIEELLKFKNIHSPIKILPIGTLRLYRYRWSANFTMPLVREAKLFEGSAYVTATQIKRISMFAGTAVFRKSRITNLAVYGGGTANLAESQIEIILVYEGITNIAKSRIAGQVVYKKGTSNLAESQIENIAVYEGITNIAKSRIANLIVYEGGTASLAESQVEIITVYKGTANIAKSQVTNHAVYQRGASNLAESQVRNVAVYQGITNIAKSRITYLAVYEGGTVNLTRTYVEHLDVYSGIVNIRTSHIGSLTIHEGTANFLTGSRVENMVILEGSASILYRIHQEIMSLLSRGESNIEGNDDVDNAEMIIKKIVLHHGHFLWAQGAEPTDINLLHYGGDVSFATYDTLLLATSPGHEELLQLLLDRGADPNKKWIHEMGKMIKHTEIGEDGWALLHMAAFNGDERLVRILIENRADISLTDDDGRTALQIAASQGYERIVRLLENNGNDPSSNSDIVEREQQTVLQKIANAVYNALLLLSV
ncbi:Ankycorbin [Dactylella cylindrospora]|nr:Ankycorbin [Dactylella cylindrospora]